MTAHKRPLVLAHRGNSRFAPENTLAAFREAFALGADGVECDLRLTRDGHIVLIHDATVDRTAGAHGKVAEMTLAELRRLDAGSWKHAKYAGERIPTFEEAARLAEGKGTWVLDLKVDGLGAKIASTLRNLDIPQRCMIACPWSIPQARDIREHLPGMGIYPLGKAPAEPDPEFFRERKRLGARGFSYALDSVSPEFIEAARGHAMGLFAWTVNAPADMAAAIRLGLDGIITDDPAALIQTLRGAEGVRE